MALGGLGFELRSVKEILCAQSPFRWTLWPTQPPSQGIAGLCFEDKAAGAWC